MHSSSTLLWAALAATGLADSHYFFSGFFAGSSLVGVEFDDAASTLSLVHNMTLNTTAGSKWIAIDAQKKNVYVGTTGYYQSYAITSNRSLTYQSEVALPADCPNANFIAAAQYSPYTVFGTPYLSGGCDTQAMSVDESGNLQEVVANITYNSAAGVHGTAISPNEDFLYSADDMGNAVWTHSWDSSTNAVEEIQYIAAPTGADPRHLTVHPNGEWVYVVYEGISQIAVYQRDNETGLLTDTNTTYPLLPTGYTNTSSYWADEVLFSIPSSNGSALSPKYLVAATRSRTESLPGYVSAFALDATTGGITEQLFLLPTTASGGSANAVAPAPFSEEYFAITDSAANTIEMWKLDDDPHSAKSVASISVPNGPANVVWYS